MAEKKRRSIWSKFAPKVSLADWRLHPLTLFILATVATIVGGIWLWQSNKSELLDRAAFQLTSERLSVTPQPEYVATDLKKAAFDGSQLADVNLLDSDLVSKVHAAFSVHSWIRQVAVRKNRFGVDVELTYRKPVALVEFGDNLLLPVDQNGVVLDGADFNSKYADQLPRISVESPQVGSLVHGDAWPDERIVAAAMIAELILPTAKDWGILRIAHVPLTVGSNAPEGEFEFLTAAGNSGIRVLWGSPPGFERLNEVSPAQKLETLGQWISERGSLADIGTTQTIDLRSGQIKLLSSR